MANVNSKNHIEFRFAADRTLGKLAKWLRILGFDTIYESDVSTQWFYSQLDEARILLTRTKKMRKQFSEHRQVFIAGDDLFGQLRQVVDELAINFNESRLFSRCIRCNTPIVPVAKESVYGLVPDYIWETHDEFNRCCQCKKIFWPGSHTERSKTFIEQLFD